MRPRPRRGHEQDRRRDFREWLAELTSTYATADDIAGDPYVFADDLKKLILDLGNEGYFSD